MLGEVEDEVVVVEAMEEREERRERECGVLLIFSPRLKIEDSRSSI